MDVLEVTEFFFCQKKNLAFYESDAFIRFDFLFDFLIVFHGLGNKPGFWSVIPYPPWATAPPICCIQQIFVSVLFPPSLES